MGFDYPIRTRAKTPAEQLMAHPNFTMPDTPTVMDGIGIFELVTYVLETTARMVSPPKEDGEDASMSCDDLARAIRGLRTKLVRELQKHA